MKHTAKKYGVYEVIQLEKDSKNTYRVASIQFSPCYDLEIVELSGSKRIRPVSKSIIRETTNAIMDNKYSPKDPVNQLRQTDISRRPDIYGLLRGKGYTQEEISGADNIKKLSRSELQYLEGMYQEWLMACETGPETIEAVPSEHFSQAVLGKSFTMTEPAIRKPYIDCSDFPSEMRDLIDYFNQFPQEEMPDDLKNQMLRVANNVKKKGKSLKGDKFRKLASHVLKAVRKGIYPSNGNIEKSAYGISQQTDGTRHQETIYDTRPSSGVISSAIGAVASMFKHSLKDGEPFLHTEPEPDAYTAYQFTPAYPVPMVVSGTKELALGPPPTYEEAFADSFRRIREYREKNRWVDPVTGKINFLSGPDIPGGFRKTGKKHQIGDDELILLPDGSWARKKDYTEAIANGGYKDIMREK